MSHNYDSFPLKIGDRWN